VKRYDAATTSLQTATQVEPGQAYWVQLATSATWTPPLPQDVSTRFTYDGDGGRVKQVTAAGTTTYLGETYEKDATGKTTKYVFAGSLRIAAKDSTGTLRFYHGDHLGSSHVITDGTGQLVELTEHTPYGSLSRTEGSYDSPFKFTGQRQDPGTGLILFPARAYDPELGRFLQADPFVQDPSDPQTLNRYAYVRNNPINLVDPTGHFFFAIFAAIVAITKVAAVGAAVGAAVNAGIAAVTGGDVGKAALSGAGFGATFAVAGALAAPALASATAAAQAGSALARVGAFTIQAAQFGAAGAVGGGIDSSYDGGSFGRGAGTGALVSVATFGAGKALGPVFNQIGEAIGPQLAQVGQAVASSSVGQQLGRYFAQGSDDAVYAGVRHASSFLQQLGVSRDVRVKLLSTVDPRTVGLDFAGTSSYALRYFGGRARARGHALFDTFPATRDSLAVKLDWNTMEFFKQWQIRPGAPIIYGRALPQGGLSGGQMQRGVIDPLRDLLD
jgi:RHS repeat-associated protein